MTSFNNNNKLRIAILIYCNYTYFVTDKAVSVFPVDMDKEIESQRSSRIGIFKSKGGSSECRLEKVVQWRDQYYGNKNSHK